MPPSQRRKYKRVLLEKKQAIEKILKQDNVIINSTRADSHQAKCNHYMQPLTLNTANYDKIHQNNISPDNWNYEDIQQLDPCMIDELRECGKILEVVLSKHLNQPWEKFYKALMEEISDK